MREIVVSGIRATGKLHLGNYLGAMRNFLVMQEKYDCFFFVADYHTLTTHPNPDELRDNIPEIVGGYLAIGLDPNKCAIFAQSSIPEITELCLLLSMLQPVGELLRLPTYKEKVRKQPDNINHGLLTYPVLMAADILIQKADLVPVGSDQLPHIELTQEVARRFNRQYGRTFPMPHALMEKAIRVPGLDGSEKMGKSDGNTIDLADSPKAIRQKIARAVTDTKRQYRADPGNPFDCNLYAIHEYLSQFENPLDDPDVKAIREGCQSAGIGCSECKAKLSESVICLLQPIQEAMRGIAANPGYVQDVLRAGALRARRTARETVSEAREKMGLRQF